MVSSVRVPASREPWLFEPQPIERLAVLRVGACLAVLGFMSTRIVHADRWLGRSGFAVPDLGGDWRQPLYLAPLPDGLAWTLACVMVLAGLGTLVGYKARWSAGIFAATLVYVALADRLASFTVTKVSPVVMLTLCVSGAGARYSLDRWLLARRASAPPPPTHAPGGPIRFVQVLLPTFYCASGICKARGDWLERSDVLWTHLHDSYQTEVSLLLANQLPMAGWAALQHTTLLFEIGAPLWFYLHRTRMAALVYGLAMHAMIALMFGPVKWFSLLMISLLLAAYLPSGLLTRAFGRVSASSPPAPASVENAA